MEDSNFRVGQIRLCYRTWNKYTVTKVDGEKITVKYNCDCHGFKSIKGDRYSVEFEKGYSLDRILKK